MGDPSTRDRTWAPFLLIVGVAGLLLHGTLTDAHDWGDDFAAYVMQARSLVEEGPRRFVEANRFTIEESAIPLGPVAYPWGFPALLAPVYAVFDLDVVALKSVGALSYLLFLVLLWSAFRRAHARPFFLYLVGLFAVNPILLAFPNQILSDLPFLLLSTLGIVLIGRVVVEGRRILSPCADAAILGAAIAAAFFVRPNGLLLLVTLAASQAACGLARRRRTPPPVPPGEPPPASPAAPGPDRGPARRWLAHLAPHLVFLALAAAWRIALPDAPESRAAYLTQASPALIKNHLHYYLELPGMFFSAIPHYELIYGATLPLAAAGVIRRRWSDHPAILYTALTIGLFVLWPETQDLRFLFPILPFYVSFTMTGLEMCVGGATRVERGLRNLACHAPVCLVIAYLARVAAQDAGSGGNRDQTPEAGPFTATARGMFSFVADHTGKDSTIVFFKPRAMRLFTGRRSLTLSDVDQMSRGDYLCVYRTGRAYGQASPADIAGLVERGAARLVYENADFSVYALRGPPRDGERR